MSLSNTCIRFAFVGLAGLALFGCRDEPKPEATAQNAPKSRKNLPSRTEVKRISPEAMKLFRLEVCYFGALGLRATRDAYQASLGGQPPSADHLPSFGVAPPEEPTKAATAEDKTAKPTAAPQVTAQGTAAPAADSALAKSGHPEPLQRRDRMADRMRPDLFRSRLPYTRHIRSCTVAKKLKQPAAPELDAATASFETYIIGLHKDVHEAFRYYGRKQYEQDDFKRGKELHAALETEFSKLDGELDSFSKAYEAYRTKVGAPPDTLDEGGQAAAKAIEQARALTLLFWAKEPDAEAIQKGIEAVTKATEQLEGLKDKQAQSPHVVVVAPALRRFIDKLTPALEEVKAGKLTTEKLFDVTYLYVAAVEANHQALARMLNPMKNRRRPDRGPQLHRPDLRAGRPAPPPLRRPDPAQRQPEGDEPEQPQE